MKYFNFDRSNSSFWQFQQATPLQHQSMTRWKPNSRTGPRRVVRLTCVWCKRNVSRWRTINKLRCCQTVVLMWVSRFAYFDGRKIIQFAHGSNWGRKLSGFHFLCRSTKYLCLFLFCWRGLLALHSELIRNRRGYYAKKIKQQQHKGGWKRIELQSCY